MILHYFLPHSTKIKIICSSLDIGWLWIPEEGSTWIKGVGNSKGFKYDSCHDFWSKNISIVDSMRNLIRNVPLPLPEFTEGLGFFGVLSQGWGDNPPPCPDNAILGMSINDHAYRQNLTLIREVADSLRTRGIYWLMINFPVSPNYKNTPAYSQEGPSWQTAHDILDTLKEIASTNDYFHLYDANKDGNHDYDSSDASDENHLSALGAEKLSGRVDSIIHFILP